jgi:mono/diheme cytochrome c family protein
MLPAQLEDAPVPHRARRLPPSTLALAVLAALLGGVVGCARAPEPPPARPHPVLVEQGAALYVAYCAACHGLAGRGDGPVAGALATRPPDLTRIAARRDGAFPDAEIALTIDGRYAPAAHGTREMPVWGQRFSHEIPEGELQQPMVRGRILVLVAFLESIQRDGP